MEKLKVLLKEYKWVHEKLKELERKEKKVREEILKEMKENDLEKVEVQVDNKKIVCLLYQELKKDKELWKRILKGFYTKIVRRKINYTVNREEIEELLKKGIISIEDFNKLLDEEKRLRIIL